MWWANLNLVHTWVGQGNLLHTGKHNQNIEHEQQILYHHSWCGWSNCTDGSSFRFKLMHSEVSREFVESVVKEVRVTSGQQIAKKSQNT